MLQFCARVVACPRSVRLLMRTEMLGLLASALGQVGVVWWIVQSDGAYDLTRYGAAMGVCSLLAMPLLSPLGDRWAKRRLIRLGKVCLLLDALALALLALNSAYQLPLLCVCSALSVLANAVLLPAQAGSCLSWSRPNGCQRPYVCAAVPRHSAACSGPAWVLLLWLQYRRACYFSAVSTNVTRRYSQPATHSPR